MADVPVISEMALVRLGFHPVVEGVALHLFDPFLGVRQVSVDDFSETAVPAPLGFKHHRTTL